MHIENNFASTWVKGGVLYSIYKEGIDIHLTAAKLIVEDRLKLQNGIALPILCDIRGVRKFDMAAKRYFSTDGSALIKALALVSNNPVSEVYSKIYIKGNLPTVPMQIFDNETEALFFLNQFIEDI
ncbi:DUF7793 family protein [Formosa algae]|uniref:DUF7793 family protein n=1 Tax=Formosa algae TaxID=225843 RepID=UPI000CCEEB14|nr:hypothetical protein [Formosa algae]PNW27285.1 hypothetical protein BKP44_13610 [Formosa algae]